MTKHFDDDERILEELDPPLAGKIVFQHPPYDEWRDRLWPDAED